MPGLIHQRRKVMQFRKDINGLRAIAVIAVVLFHFNYAWLPGGYAGVDVFFVISGFLMTGIIFERIEQQKFSILEFYLARAVRILPALTILCIALLIFGWFYMTPLDYRSLGKHVASSLSFVSNLIYWREAGYFDMASHEKWLLHTWSLSTEWQFYIIYPIVLVIMRWYTSIKNMKLAVLGGIALSFLFCIITTHKWPNAAYYLLPTRTWEMLFGGAAYLYPFKIKAVNNKLLEWFGLALIIGSYIFISKNSAWPGYLALFPVIGTFLVIQSQQNHSIITGNLVFQKIGTWSYSIYLWHWPLVVAVYYYSLSGVWIYAGITMSVIMGFLSNKYIEQIKFKNVKSPLLEVRAVGGREALLSYSKQRSITKYTHINISLLKYNFVYIAMLVGMSGSLIYLTNGCEFHYSDEIIVAAKEALNKNPYQCMTGENEKGELKPCYIGNNEKIKAIIVGDSHADALTTALSNAFDLKNEGIIAFTKASCPFVMGAKSAYNSDACYIENELRLKKIKTEFKGVPIFWVARTTAYIYGQTDPKRVVEGKTAPAVYFDKPYPEVNAELIDEWREHLQRTICELSTTNPVFLVQPTPEMGRNIPNTLARNLLLNKKDDLSLDYTNYKKNSTLVRKLISATSTQCGASILDPVDFLCIDGRCKAQLDGRPIYYDGDHMSEYGNKILTPMFNRAIFGHA